MGMYSPALFDNWAMGFNVQVIKLKLGSHLVTF